MHLQATLFSGLAGVALAVPATVKAGLPKGVYSIPLIRWRNQSAYGIEWELGNPPQKVISLADTGSDMMSFESVYDTVCTKQGFCTETGTYNNKTSTTTKWIKASFNNVVNDHGYGSYINDTMRVGGATFPNFQFGQIEEHPPFVHITKQLPAICGLGALCDTPTCDGTQTLLQQLFDKKLISRRIFSIYLGPNDPDAVGTLLIGGKDLAKRQGTVYKRNMVDIDDPEAQQQPNRMKILGHRLEDGGKNTDYPASGDDNVRLWDSGSPRWDFPTDVFPAIVQHFGLGKDTDPNVGRYEVDCKYRTPGPDRIVTLFEDGAEVEVPYHILPTKLSSGKCQIDVGSGAGLMGDAFLRGVYATFDYDKLTIEFAAAKYTKNTNIVKVD